ncbi:MAG TPA: TIGR02147 family protein [Bdellovibrio sp.]|nr:TIGR02147 family protein [Bdellovibrio sp.]
MSKKNIEPHSILNKAWQRLQKKNASYSLRALARDLDLSPSYVSRIMKGQKRLPAEQVPSFAKALRMDETAVVSLKKSLMQNFIQDVPLASSSPSSSALFDEASEKDFSLLDPWYKIALLDLATCGDLPNDPSLVGRRLGISLSEARQAIVELKEQGYLEVENSFLRKTNRLLRFPTTKSHPSIREYHRTMLKKAAEAMLATDQESFEMRSINSISVAANPAQIAKARARLTEALFEICEILHEGEASEVVQIAGQIFPISKKIK